MNSKICYSITKKRNNIVHISVKELPLFQRMKFGVHLHLDKIIQITDPNMVGNVYEFEIYMELADLPIVIRIAQPNYTEKEVINAIHADLISLLEDLEKK